MTRGARHRSRWKARYYGCLCACVLGACDAEASLGRWMGSAPDAAAEPDAGVTEDAATDAVASLDAAASVDAGPDASTKLDAALPPITLEQYMFCDARGGGPGCGFCLGDSCCREILACVELDACACWLDCTRELSLADCVDECGDPPAVWRGVSGCSDQHCVGQCPPLESP